MQKDRSINDQFAVCEKYAQREHLTVVHRFSDKAKSGASMLDRDGLRDLMAAAKRREFDVLVVEATDRLSRNQADLPWIFQHLQFHGVKIVTPANGEVSEMQIAFDGISNPGYSKKLAERVKRGHDGIAREGLVAGSLAYGYDLVIRLGTRNLTTLAYTPDFRLLWETLTFFQPLAQTKKSLRQRDFLVSVQSGPLHHAHHHQDFLLAGDRTDFAVRHLRHLFRAGRDGDQPVRRLHSIVGLDRQRHRRHHILPHRGGIRFDRVSHQRASWRDPRSGGTALARF
jgi:hypothetical protein